MSQRPLIRVVRFFSILALFAASLGFGLRPVAAQGSGLSIIDFSFPEPLAAPAPMNFTINIDPPIPAGIVASVQVTTIDGSATGGLGGAGDYTSLSSFTIVLPNGVASTTIPIDVNNDGAGNEPGENFFVLLSNPSNATINDGFAEGIIEDVPGITVEDLSTAEGLPLGIFVRLAHPFASGPVSVEYTAASGTATLGADVNCVTPSPIVFPAGTVGPILITCNTVNDIAIEPDETFTVTLANPIPAAAIITRAVGTGTIIDNDSGSELTLLCPSPVNEVALSITCTVNISPPSPTPITVRLATANGTAIAPGDYQATNLLLNIPALAPSVTQVIPISNDLINETSENFTVNLSEVTGAIISPTGASATVVIDDNDGQPTFSVTNASVTEGNNGTVDMVFTISLSAPSGQTTSVNYRLDSGLAPNGATEGIDFVDDTNTLVFSPGRVTQNLSVVINGDLLDEFDETFQLVLSAPVNAGLGIASGTGTIFDNDAPPVARINNVTVNEPNTGTVAALFSVTLENPSGKPISLSFATANGLPPGGAVSPDDFIAASGVLNFTPGMTTTIIPITVKGDTISENNETFSVNLTAVSNVATGSQSQGIGTIIDNDSGPELSVQDVTISEGDSGVVVALVTIQLSAASGKTVSFSYATADGTAQSNDTVGAIPSTGDYTKLNQTTLDIPSGTQSVQIPLEIRGDTVDEDNETLKILLSTPTNAVIGDGEGIVTITDNDAGPVVSIGDATTPSEGNAGQNSSAVFVISLSAQSGRVVTVQFTTSNGTATAGSDYIADSRAVTFEPGATTQTVSVGVNGDTIDEPNETFSATLSTPVNATLGRSVGTATIFDDDGPTVSIGDASINEPSSGSAVATFVVTLSGATSYPVVVNYASANGTASAGSDFTAVSGNLVFTSAAEITKTINVTVQSDGTSEGEESFFVNLTSVSGGGITIGDGQGRGVIRDNSPLTLSLECPAEIDEGNNGTFSLNCTVRLSAASTMTVTVDYSTSNGTATAPGDYISAVGRLTFVPGTTSNTVALSVKGDTEQENDETFTVRLTNARLQQVIAVGIVGDRSEEGPENFFVRLLDPVGATLSTNQSVITIADDDNQPYQVRLPLIWNTFIMRIPAQ